MLITIIIVVAAVVSIPTTFVGMAYAADYITSLFL